MNLPSGNFVFQAIAVKESKAPLAKLFQNNFSGYVAVTFEGFDGVEEGVLLFKNGLGVACAHSFLKYDSALQGNMALANWVNGFAAGYGVMDAVQLTPLQVDMSIAFDERLKLSAPMNDKALAKLWPQKFNPVLAQSALKEAKPKIVSHSKDDLLKKFGFAGIEE
ncbi:MAG: hypothetical protein V1847_04300 [Candidatus Diapherotrites archaeon]